MYAKMDNPRLTYDPTITYNFEMSSTSTCFKCYSPNDQNLGNQVERRVQTGCQGSHPSAEMVHEKLPIGTIIHEVKERKKSKLISK